MVDVAEESPKLFGEKVPCAGSTSCSLQLSDASLTSGWANPVGIWRPGSCDGTEGAASWNSAVSVSKVCASLPPATWLVWCSGGAKREWSGAPVDCSATWSMPAAM